MVGESLMRQGVLAVFLPTLVLALVPPPKAVAQDSSWGAMSEALRRELCAYQPLLAGAGEDRERVEDLYLKMLGVVGALAEHRRSFLTTADLIELFPTAYFHTTASEMTGIAAGGFTHPEEKLRQLLAFYDAYAENRALWEAGSPLLEPHWRDHFSAAEGLPVDRVEMWDRFLDAFSSGVASTLKTGIRAHVDFDLPRAIRHAFETRRTRTLGGNDLLPDFKKTDRVFENTVRRTNLDITFALGGHARQVDVGIGDVLRHVSLQLGSLFSADSVQERRSRAWGRAFGSEALEGIDGTRLAGQPGRHHETYRAGGEHLCNGSEVGRPTLFLLDTSGSMSENDKIGQARRSALASLHTIRRNSEARSDRPSVSILTFGGSCSPDSTRVILDFTDDLDRAEELLSSGAMTPNGRTPLPQALETARKRLAEFQRAHPKAPKPSLVLLSDGQSTCGDIRPSGVYGFGDPGSTRSRFVDGDFYAVGFDLEPGSPGERDLQYLSSANRGRYFPAHNPHQLSRAFEKAVKTYRPKRYPVLGDVSGDHSVTFVRGVLAILGEELEQAKSLLSTYLDSNGSDPAGHFNLALALDATDRHLRAAEHYERYLALAPDAADRAEVEREIPLLRQDHRDHRAYQIELLRSDLEYLKRYYQDLFHRSNTDLSIEFAGFLREKQEFYARLPEQLGVEEPWLERATEDLAASFERIALRLGTPSFDRDAVSLLTLPIGRLEEILRRLEK